MVKHRNRCAVDAYHAHCCGPAAAVIISALFVLFLSCAAQVRTVPDLCPGNKTDPVSYSIHDNGKYCGVDHYIVRAEGKPDAKEKDIEKRKTRARYAAVLFAQYRVIEYFRGYRSEQTGMSEFSPEYIDRRSIWLKELTSIAKTGRVVSEKFLEDQTCVILYEVTRTDFRKWAETSFHQN